MKKATKQDLKDNGIAVPGSMNEVVDNRYFKRYKQFNEMMKDTTFLEWLDYNGEDVLNVDRTTQAEFNMDSGSDLIKSLKSIYNEFRDITFSGQSGETETETGHNLVGISNRMRARLFVQLYIYWLKVPYQEESSDGSQFKIVDLADFRPKPFIMKMK